MKKFINDIDAVMRESLGGMVAAHPELLRVEFEPTFVARDDSDWNGSDGKPLPQLWDTAGHYIAGLVSTAATDIDVEIITGDDCVTTVANLVHLKPAA